VPEIYDIAVDFMDMTDDAVSGFGLPMPVLASIRSLVDMW